MRKTLRKLQVETNTTPCKFCNGTGIRPNHTYKWSCPKCEHREIVEIKGYQTHCLHCGEILE